MKYSESDTEAFIPAFQCTEILNDLDANIDFIMLEYYNSGTEISFGIT